MRFLSGLWWLEEGSIGRLTQMVQIMRGGLSVGFSRSRFDPARSGPKVFCFFFSKKKFFPA
jgi:hypothetical protein